MCKFWARLCRRGPLSTHMYILPELTLHWEMAKSMAFSSSMKTRDDRPCYVIRMHLTMLDAPRRPSYTMKNAQTDLKLCKLVNKNVNGRAITKLHVCIPQAHLALRRLYLASTTSAAVNITNYVQNLGQIAQSEIFKSVIVKWKFQ